MDSYILALETSSSRCGVALLSVVQGRQSLIRAGVDATGQHAERLLPMVDQILLEAGIARKQLSAVGFGQGPGGFTGLRVACGVAQGISYALGLQVLPIASLLAVAAQDAAAPGADRSAWRLVVQDARMGEVYLAAYRPVAQSPDVPDAWQELCAPILLNSDDVPLWLARQIPHWREAPGGLQSLRVVGDALDAYPDLAGLAGGDVVLGQPLRPDVEVVARLAYQAWRRGESVPPERAAPLYVRDKVAYTTLEREQGLGGNPKAGLVADAADTGGAQPVSLRAMVPGDLDDVVQIERAVQAFPWTRGNFQDALKSGYGAWVARLDEKIVGCCLALFAPDVGHLLLIAVAPDAQQKGVGERLLACCERVTLAHGLRRLILEVRPSNERAIAFYKHRGFERLSVRKNYYPAGQGEREDAWVLEKTLTAPRAHHE
jgi:tRNA threonylcarbamoyladenosine biosynthesis protein TsaB